MHSTSSSSRTSVPLARWSRPHAEVAFTLVELLVVMGIIAILTAIAVPLLPAMMRSNQMNQNISNLSGVLEQAREAAVAQNTYVWVAFTSPSSGSPSDGIWVATFQSNDGTETGVNTSTSSSPSWTNTASIPGANLQVQSKLKNLPGAQIVASSGLPVSITTNFPTVLTTSLQTNLAWTVAQAGFTDLTNATFTQAIEFTPSGEAHTGLSASYNYVQFGLTATTGSTADSAGFSVSKTTGHTSVYRP